MPWTLVDGESDLAWLGIESERVTETGKALAESQRKLLDKIRRKDDDDDDAPCIARQDAPGVAPAFTPARQLLLCTRVHRWHRLRPKGTPQWVLTGPSGAEVVRVPVGRGQVTMTLAEDLHDNDTLLKDAGARVSRGDAVAKVGNSGGQGVTALYFELRRGGQPVNPDSWLQRR